MCVLKSGMRLPWEPYQTTIHYMALRVLLSPADSAHGSATKTVPFTVGTTHREVLGGQGDEVGVVDARRRQNHARANVELRMGLSQHVRRDQVNLHPREDRKCRPSIN
jgi:hypothetical protein